MPTVNLSALGGAASQFFDNNGVILSGGKIYAYAAGTTTPQATYTSSTGVTPHANPIILDSAGRVPNGEIWLIDNLVYKFVIETATGSLLGTYDNVPGINDINLNAAVVEYDPPFTGAVTSGYTVADKLSQTVSVKDFGAVGNGVANDTVAIQAAINTGDYVYIPAGDYLVGALTLVDNVQIYGEGRLVSNNASTILTGTSKSGFTVSCRFKGGNVAYYGIDLTSCTNFTIENCEFDGFGASVGFRGALRVVGTSTNFLITGNLCKNGLGDTAADIGIGESANGGVVTNNRCLSLNSEGITIQMDSPNPARLTVSNNYCANHTRHGILGVYNNGKPTQCSYTSNVCYNNGWSGIYLQGQTAGVGFDSGQVSCVGNVCVANGGLDNLAIFNSGIYVAGDLGYSIVGNTVHNSGFDSSGVARAYAADGIRCVNAENAVVSANNISNSSRSGISLGGTDINNVTISDNVILNSGGQQISLSVNGAGVICRNLVVKGNQLNAITTDPDGIVFGVSSTAEWRDFTVAYNKISGRKLASSQRGIWVFAATVALIRGDIFGNTIFNYDTGIYSNSSLAQLAYGGRNLRIKDNSLISCTEGINVPSGSAAWALIDYNVYSANGTNVVGTWVRYGKITEVGTVEMYDTAPPSFAAWGDGDRVWNTAPAAGGAPGWVCTTAGTPGTWKAMANLAP
jgi:hypothetical protein